VNEPIDPEYLALIGEPWSGRPVRNGHDVSFQDGVTTADFSAYMPMHSYIYTPKRTAFHFTTT
jgi:hypothetical protein